MEYFHLLTFMTLLTTCLLEIGDTMNIASKTVPLENWGHYSFFLRAATAFDVLGTNNAGELDTYGYQYPILSISIPHFVARIFGCK